MLIVLRIVFWTCATAVVYAYAVYPVLIFVISRIFGSPQTPVEAPGGARPTVSLLVVAHNEEMVIEQRISNALDVDWPAELLEIVIASDGSDDETVEIAKRYGDRIRLMNYVERRGKAATLSTSIPRLRGDIVVLSDANTWIDPTAVRSLTRWFTE